MIPLSALAAHGWGGGAAEGSTGRIGERKGIQRQGTPLGSTVYLASIHENSLKLTLLKGTVNKGVSHETEKSCCSRLLPDLISSYTHISHFLAVHRLEWH